MNTSTTAQFGANRTSPVSEVLELIARADKYLNTGSGEYASEIMRDMANFLQRHSSEFAQCQQQWQPIETAPKDGSDILLYWPLDGLHPNFARTKIGYWHHRGEWVWQDRAFRTYSEEPTHWMPLPTAPALSNTSTVRQATPATCSVCHGEGVVSYIQSAGGFSEPAPCYQCEGSGRATSSDSSPLRSGDA